MKQILIIDDDIAVTNYFLVFLTQTEEYESTVVNDSRKVSDLLEHEHFDIILLDMDMPDVNGLDILKLIKERDMRIPVVVLTGVGDVDMAVKAMKLGAFDYLTKPVEDKYLLEVLNQAIEYGAVHRTINELPSELKREDLSHGAAFESFITQDPRMIRLLHEAEKIASGDMTVFLIGESGTGREALARAMHEVSHRRENRFAALDAAAERPQDLPGLLFGRAKSWQGGEEWPGFLTEAQGGTLFVDHIESLSVSLQLRLKRVIQTGSFYRENSTRNLTANVRLIIGSTKDLTSSEYRGRFSRDLLYHLMVNTLRLIPLHERPDDVRLIAEHVMREAGAQSSISAETIDVLRHYSFPENDAELRAIVRSALVRAESDVVTPNALPVHVLKQRPGADDFESRPLAEVEREHVLRTLAHCKGDKSRAAIELGITKEQVEAFLGAEGREA